MGVTVQTVIVVGATVQTTGLFQGHCTDYWVIVGVTVQTIGSLWGSLYRLSLLWVPLYRLLGHCVVFVQTVVVVGSLYRLLGCCRVTVQTIGMLQGHCTDY